MFGDKGQNVHSTDEAVSAVPLLMELVESLPGGRGRDAVLGVIKFFSREQSSAEGPWSTVQQVASTLIEQIVQGSKGLLGLEGNQDDDDEVDESSSVADKTGAILRAASEIRKASEDGHTADDIAKIVPQAMKAIKASHAFKTDAERAIAVEQLLGHLAEQAAAADRPAWEAAISTVRASMHVYNKVCSKGFCLNSGGQRSLAEVAAEVLAETGVAAHMLDHDASRWCPCL